MGWLSPSPFIIDGPLDGLDAVGREEETATLLEWAAQGGNVAIVAPRRFGKTTLLNKVAAEADPDRLLVVTADMYEVASMADLVIRLERAWNRARPGSLLSRAAQALTGAGVGVSIAGTGFQVTLADKPQTDPLPALHTLLDLPGRIASKGSRVVVVLDEFQSVGNVSGAEALIRSFAQNQRGVASYFFAGSEPSMMRAAFGDRARPFYSQVETMTLGRLAAPALVEAILDRFHSTGRECADVVAPLVELGEEHPQRTMLLAHRLWQETPEGGSATPADLDVAVARAVAGLDYEARAVLSGLGTAQVKALRAVAEYAHFARAQALRVMGVSRDSATTAGRALADRALIEPTSDGWRVTDPLLGRWLRCEYGTRPTSS